MENIWEILFFQGLHWGGEIGSHPFICVDFLHQEFQYYEINVCFNTTAQETATQYQIDDSSHPIIYQLSYTIILVCNAWIQQWGDVGVYYIQYKEYYQQNVLKI